jgi:excinuclease ABC subunit A
VSSGHIELRGVAVNNLRSIDLDLPRGQLIVICGVSGSGKTSLALDTLYAEGQRRYIETFSPFARQYLERLDKPNAERIDGIPPAIAVTHRSRSRSKRATVGTATEIHRFLSELFARLGDVTCCVCGRKVRQDTPESAAEALVHKPPSLRLMITFESRRHEGESTSDWVARLSEAGYIRAIAGAETVEVIPMLAPHLEQTNSLTLVLDRLTTGESLGRRLHDSLESAFSAGRGACIVYVERAHAGDQGGGGPYRDQSQKILTIDGRDWSQESFSDSMKCDECGTEYPDLEPRLFDFDRPLGACPVCEGSGEACSSGGVCPACGGARLRPEVLAVRVGGYNVAEVSRMPVVQVGHWLAALELPPWQQRITTPLVDELSARLRYLLGVGVGYLTLDRPLRTLSGGESQRIAVTSALGSTLVDVLYVLDEPSAGLHPRDVESLADAVEELTQRGNTVVVVEHDAEVICRANRVVELGPGAGEDGGSVVFQGSTVEMMASQSSQTGDWLSGRRRLDASRRRPTTQGWIKLRGARGHNLRNLTVEFPLGVFCMVTGVSGAGKSSLVKQTLYSAILRQLHQSASSKLPDPLPHDDIRGAGHLDDVQLVDQSPVGRSPRSNPATYLKAFDPIRALFADQLEARARGFTAGHFSFNIDGGRCEACKGDGFLAIDMQFLPDVYIRCGECGGRRYRREVLEVKYRGRDISEVLDMTAREAFIWFRGEHAVQSRLKPLVDVGLGYLRLGQPAATLSGGEAQRLKLAAHLDAKRRGRTLFVLEEPSAGLHYADLVQLMDAFDALVEVGHSLIVIEHNLQLMKAADYLIDLGPGAADEGGQIVAVGTPEDIAACPQSVTGQYLSKEFARDAEYSNEMNSG